MKIKTFKLFENFSESEIEMIRTLFIDLFDLEHETFQIRSDTSETKYQKVFRSDWEITKTGNFIIRIYCDFLMNYAIENEIKQDIIPRLKSMGYKASVKNEKTSEYFSKKLPTSTGGYAYVSDPVHRISVLVKH
jgi:hypothetical protein